MDTSTDQILVLKVGNKWCASNADQFSTVRLHSWNIATKLEAATLLDVRRRAEELWRRTWWTHILAPRL